MKSIRRILSFTIQSGGVFLRTILGFLLTPDDTDSDDRPQGEGSDLFGEHNFRTGRADSGTDPDGWYEEDL